MSAITPKSLEDAIKSAGTTASALATAIGRDKDYIRDYLVGRKRSLKADDLKKIADHIGLREVGLSDPGGGIRIVGSVRAGTWIETYLLEHEDRGTIPVSRDLRFPHARQYGLAVSGDSMDLEAPDGSYVVCVDALESGLSLKAGMMVHVESIEVGKSEATLKEIAFENGQMILVPKSSNPIYKPITAAPHDGIEVHVRGVVLSVYNPRKL